MIEDENWNNYFIPNTDILKNKLNITDENLLKKHEKEITTKKLIELYLNPIQGNFDSKHLCKIHKFIFEDIYYFAGEFRNVNMGKTHTASFSDYNQIEEKLNELLNNIDSKIINIAYSDFLYAEALARVYHLLIDIHPFREGNGRTIREFMREYVEAKNYYFNDIAYHLDFTKMDRDKFFNGTINPISNMGELVIEFTKALIKVPIKNKTK